MNRTTILRFVALTIASASALSISARAEADEPKSINVQAGNLTDALETLARQYGVNVIYTSSELRGVKTRGVSGTLTSQDAVRKLLEGTSLEVKTDPTGAVMITLPGKEADAHASLDSGSLSTSRSTLRLARSEAATTETVATTESQTGNSEDATTDDTNTITVFGRSRSQTQREVPQTVQVFNQNFLADVSAVDISDVVRFVPSSAPQYSQIGWLSDAYSVRGFSVTEVINGARLNTANYPLDSQFMERVEVLMGPASVLYGSMQPGAVINIVTKKPRDTFHFEGGAEFGSYNHQRYTVDVGGPVSQRVKVRLNAVYQDRESFLDYWSEQKLTVVPAVAFDLSDRTSLNLEGLYTDTDQPAGGYLGSQARGLLTDNPNGDYPRSFYVQRADEEGVGRTRTTKGIETTLKHQFTDAFSARAVFAYNRTSRSDQTITGLLQSDLHTLNRLQVGNVSDGDDYSYYIDATAQFSTGVVKHQLSFGAEYVTSKFDNLQTRYNVNQSDLYAPVYGAVLLLANRTRYLPTVMEGESRGAFIQDRITIADRLHLIAGTRYAKITSRNTGNESTQSDWPTMFGAVYDVTDSVSLYTNRSESFIPRSGTTSDNRVFPPESSIQYEGGAKFDIGRHGASGTVALFKVEKPDVLTPDLNNPGFLAPLGKVQAKGFEASLQGELLPGCTMFTSYAHMTTDVQSNDQNLDGNDLQYAPKNTVSLASRYEVRTGALQGLNLTAAVQYGANRYLDAANTLLAPSFTRVDLGASYTFAGRTEVGLLIRNVTNADIFSGYGPNNVDINPPRTYFARMIYKLQP